ncbi:MAG: hypothetical protein HND48_26745 [Chloroflexi bacterium]|nr:hypothetical protein [Chloroflexota bacterium]
MSLRLMDASGYWDTDVIAEDSHMFIKAFFSSDAELELEPIFLPFLATATTGDTVWEVVKARYQQTLRHAWGSKEVGYIIARMLEHPEIPAGRGLKLLLRVAHDILLAGAGWIILTVGSQLPVLFNPGAGSAAERNRTRPDHLGARHRIAVGRRPRHRVLGARRGLASAPHPADHPEGTPAHLGQFSAAADSDPHFRCAARHACSNPPLVRRIAAVSGRA